MMLLLRTRQLEKRSDIAFKKDLGKRKIEIAIMEMGRSLGGTANKIKVNCCDIGDLT